MFIFQLQSGSDWGKAFLQKGPWTWSFSKQAFSFLEQMQVDNGDSFLAVVTNAVMQPQDGHPTRRRNQAAEKANTLSKPRQYSASNKVWSEPAINTTDSIN